MLDNLTKFVDLPSRALMASLFLLSGVGKIANFSETQGYMEAFGLPGFMLVPTIVFEIATSILILIGLGTRFVALSLAGFCLLSAMIFHRNFGDQIQMIMFLKNLVMAGGFLMLAKAGASTWSVDGLRESRKVGRS